MSVDAAEAWQRAAKLARVQADLCYPRSDPRNAKEYVRLRAKIFEQYTRRDY